MMRISDDRAAWLSRFVLPHEPALRAWLKRKRVVGLDIDDIVQETYARLASLVRGTEHWDFANFPLLSPLQSLTGLAGAVPTPRMLSLTNAYVTAFFDQHLAGNPSALLLGPSADYPEVDFVSRLPTDDAGSGS